MQSNLIPAGYLFRPIKVQAPNPPTVTAPTGLQQRPSAAAGRIQRVVVSNHGQAGVPVRLDHTVVEEIPMMPSPFRSCWKLGSNDSSAPLEPDTMPPVPLETTLPLVSVFQTVYWFERGKYRATSYPLAIFSAPITSSHRIDPR